MLSLSADIAQQDINLQVINGEGDGGILHGLELSRFAEAVARSDGSTLPGCREGLLQAAGNDVLVGVVGALALKIKDPIFESQSNNKLGNADMRSWIVTEI